MFLKIGILFTMPLLIVGALVLKDGVVVVDVTDRREDSRVFVPVPLSLVNFGLQMLPDGKLDEVSARLSGCEPYLQAVSEQLVDLPDVDFVEVKTPREQFHLAKRGNSLVFDLDTQDEKIHVSVPIRGMNRVFQNLADAAE
jgi:hypothetical protein